MTSQKDKLIAQVEATNKANAFAKELYPKLREVFEPFVGQKITKVDLNLLEKVKKLIPELPYTPTLHAHVSTGRGYFVTCNIRVWVSTGEHGGVSHEVHLYVGDLKDGVLEKLYEAPNFRSDYTVGEIEQKRAAYKAAQKLADDAKSALYPFGEYTN